MSRWTPDHDRPDLTLAAIRWYAVSIEKLATDLYVTNRELYPAVKAVLEGAFLELGRMRKKLHAAAQEEEDGCPPGYVNCDGLCLPSCDKMEY